MSITCNENAWKFLLKAYFGAKENDETTVIKQCIDRAYLDMCRTLDFTDKEKKKSDKEKKENGFRAFFSPKIEKIIIEKEKIRDIQNECYKLFFTEDSEEIEKEVEKRCNSFTYGQAQKWINMSLKYLWLLGLIKEDEALDVPIDSIIMKKASDNLNVKFPVKNSEKYDEYSESKSVTWSNLSKEQYEIIQKNLKKSIKKTNQTPLEWENCAWIE